jgi:hypothetical protein
MSKAKVKNLTDTIIIVGPVRLSYLNVFKPRLNKTRKQEEFSATSLIPKKAVAGFCEDPEVLLEAVRTAIEKALIAKFKAIPKKFENWVLKDGDLETDNEGEAKHPGYFYVSSRSDVSHPPVLIDAARKPIMEEKDLQSGYWGYVKISVYAYETEEGTKGVSVSLRAIQKYKEDETFGASVDPEAVAQEFDEVDEDFLA